MFVDNTIRCLMCVLKVCRNISFNVAHVCLKKEEVLALLLQPVLPGDLPCGTTAASTGPSIASLDGFCLAKIFTR